MWVRIDDQLAVHPKIRALSDSAFRLYISAICWCNAHQTDGVVTSQHLRFVSDVRRPKVYVDELVSAGLFDAIPRGWKIHDYLEYQPSAAKIRHVRDLKRERQSRWRQQEDASPDDDVDASTDASADTSLVHARVPIPIPTITSPVNQEPAGSSESAKKPDKTVIQAIRGAVADRSGHVISDDHAMRIAQQLTAGQTVRNPVAYITAAIMRETDMRRFLPTSIPQNVNGTAAEREAARANGAGPPPEGLLKKLHERIGSESTRHD